MHSEFPLHFPDFYAGDPYPAYKELRATAPVCWNDVTKFLDVVQIRGRALGVVQSGEALLHQAKQTTVSCAHGSCRNGLSKRSATSATRRTSCPRAPSSVRPRSPDITMRRFLYGTSTLWSIDQWDHWQTGALVRVSFGGRALDGPLLHTNDIRLDHPTVEQRA